MMLVGDGRVTLLSKVMPLLDFGRKSLHHEGHEGREVGQRSSPFGHATLRSNRSPMISETISREIIRAALKVHSVLGPGLLESAYRACLAHDLALRGLKVETEVPLAVSYNGVRLDIGYRIDLVIDDIVVVELKTVNRLIPVHEAQLLSYLRLSNRPVGLLINFHAPRLRDGIKRMVN